MKKKEEPKNRSTELFRNASALQRFIYKYEKQFEKLTKREIEILALLAKEWETAAIAEELGVTPAVVEQQQEDIRQKLSITTRADYVKYALAFGLIPF